jgi:hypothetical protein
MEEIDDEDQHHPNLENPVKLSPKDEVTVEDIKRMADEIPAFDKDGKFTAKIWHDLEEMDKFVQEFTYACYPHEHYSDNGRESSP